MDMSVADYAAINGNDGMFGGNGLWFLAILFLFGNGGFGFGGRNQAATTDELSAGFNFAGVNNSLKDLMLGQANINQNLGNAICNSTYELASKIDSCCCQNERIALENRYLASQNTAEINANTTAQIQKVLDAITGNRMADMQNQINQLQLQSALCGIPRTSPYGYGIYAYPTCQTACGCANI